MTSEFSHPFQFQEIITCCDFASSDVERRFMYYKDDRRNFGTFPSTSYQTGHSLFSTGIMPSIWQSQNMSVLSVSVSRAQYWQKGRFPSNAEIGIDIPQSIEQKARKKFVIGWPSWWEKCRRSVRNCWIFKVMATSKKPNLLYPARCICRSVPYLWKSCVVFLVCVTLTTHTIFCSLHIGSSLQVLERHRLENHLFGLDLMFGFRTGRLTLRGYQYLYAIYICFLLLIKCLKCWIGYKKPHHFK